MERGVAAASLDKIVMAAILENAARVRAITAHKDPLNIWKNADPDLAIYKQAKAE